MRHEKFIVGDRFRVTLKTDPDDFNAIHDDEAAEEAAFWLRFEDGMANDGTFISTHRELPTLVNGHGNYWFEREYQVDQLADTSVYAGASLVPVFPFLAAAIIIAALSFAWSASTFRSAVEITVKRLTPRALEDIAVGAREIPSAVKTVAVALVIALIVGKLL